MRIFRVCLDDDLDRALENLDSEHDGKVSLWTRSLPCYARLAEQRGAPGWRPFRHFTDESSAASELGFLQARRWLLKFVLPGCLRSLLDATRRDPDSSLE